MIHILSYLYIIVLTLYMNGSKAVATEETSKNVCSGDSVHLFRNVTIDNITMVVSLYIKASNERILAMWTLNNSTISDGYTKKVFLDKNGDIWINNVSSSDEAQYILISIKGTNVSRNNVTLNLQVAPTINCKPTIIRVDDVLVASLNNKECGKPLVSVNWLDYPGVRNEGNEFVLPKTNKYGIYYACISGPAVKCAKTSKLSDYCSAFAISDTADGHDVSSKPVIEKDEQTYFVVILVVNLLELALIILGLLFAFRRKFKNGILCGNRKRPDDVEQSDYTAVPTIELSDVNHSRENNSELT